MLRTSRPLALCAGLILALIGAIEPALGDEPRTPPTNAIGGGGLHRIDTRGSKNRTAGESSTGGWWLGTVGVALALAAFGGISLASRRFLPGKDSGSLRVVGRVALSPKHAACLLRVEDRVLLIGVGPQGAPTLLGEWDEPAPATPRRDGGAA